MKRLAAITLALLTAARAAAAEPQAATSPTPVVPRAFIPFRISPPQWMPEAKALGHHAGLNVLTTIGHHEENLPNSLSGDYTNLTYIDGSLCRGPFCLNDPQVQESIYNVYYS